MYIIIDWQNEDDIRVLKTSAPYSESNSLKTFINSLNQQGETARFSKIEDATQRLVEESYATKNIYLNIVEI